MNARLEGPRPRSRECPPTGQRLKPRLKACRHETDLRRLGNGASSCHVCPLLLDCSHVISPVVLPAESWLIVAYARRPGAVASRVC